MPVSSGTARLARSGPAVTLPTAEHGLAPEEIDMLVAQALDDLDGGNLDIEAALRTIAHSAWAAGRRAARSDPDSVAFDPEL